MGTATAKVQCSACNEAPSTILCPECSKDFCLPCLTKHTQMPGQHPGEQKTENPNFAASTSKLQFSDKKLFCGGRACAKCGHCRDRYWRPDDSKGGKAYTKRDDATCGCRLPYPYGDPDDYLNDHHLGDAGPPNLNYGVRGHGPGRGYYHGLPELYGMGDVRRITYLCECDDNHA